MLRYFRLILALSVVTRLFGAGEPLDYFLSDGGPYDESVPTPAEHFGFEVGEWHLRPDQIESYLRALAAAAPARAKVEVYGHTHEQRPLLQFIVAAPERLADLEAVREEHLALGRVGARPAVVNLGYSIHGNEASGANAAMVVAYWLVASEHPAAQAARRDLVVLLDPMFNPDGVARFAHWANTHRGQNLVADRYHREHREPWPNGRTNHYWFDLNRDWFPLVHPESQARIGRYHQWLPNIMNDHHEMGTDKTFFFQPGVPSRNNPTTPARVYELQEQLATHHVAALDRAGSFFYSAEGYDDFYVGKGSVYPDLTGGLGILYEQASSRGHVQETDFGDMPFAFTIRNQVIASLSTLAGAVAMRGDLLEHQREFYATANDFAQERGIGGWVIDPAGDRGRAWELQSRLAQHQIEVHALKRDVEIGDRTYAAGEALWVPAAQPQARLLAELFTDRREFTDTAFYDISAWSVPLAFNLPHATVAWGDARGLAGEALTVGPRPVGELVGSRDGVRAYLIEGYGFDVPRALGRLGQAGIVSQIVTEPFQAVPAGADADAAVTLSRGSVLVPVTRQASKAAEIEAVIDSILAEDAVTVVALASGHTPDGPDLGSPSLVTATAGRVAVLTGDGLSPYDAGAVWHTLDTRYGLPVLLLELDDVASADLSRLDAIVMVDGRYSGLSSRAVAALAEWVRDGGTLVTFERAAAWAADTLKAPLAMREAGGKSTDEPRQPFARGERLERAKLIPGTVFAADVDLTHPLAYGLGSEVLPLFRQGKVQLETSESPYQTPLVYADEPLLAGYARDEDVAKLAGQAAAVVAPMGRGRVVAMTDLPVFRGYWFGSMRLLGNAIFYGPAMRTP
ncbi:DUF4350 domain-containing protein [Actomonas aquatica]|uniref:DUF4350 domain-containing protein n=1 Tax=Actomonas aquatica TaxID=2866162 RepID=A0ABZ1C789_9BACT|nr:DUF4350 domain-containing protein [Opitutus sp. WL0086]WRQ86379.1 DUF4350 domain-containing protein [Opitutus sp. WL0086]